MPLGIPHSKFLSWDEDDQDKALAYMAEKRSVCEHCGTRKEVWDADPNAYVGWQDRCKGCEVIEQEKDNIDQAHSKGVKVMLVPREWAIEQMELGAYGS